MNATLRISRYRKKRRIIVFGALRKAKDKKQETRNKKQKQETKTRNKEMRDLNDANI
jgi:hypothetical protein